MDMKAELHALRQENAALRRENETLHRAMLQAHMERAVQDDHLSQRLVTELTDYFGDTVAPWFMCILFHGSPSAQKGISHQSPLLLVAQTYGPVLESFGKSYFFEVLGTMVCLLNITLPAGRNPRQLGADLSALIKAALLRAHQKTAAKTGVSHISMSHISNMEDGPRKLYRSAVNVSEHRTSCSETVCTEYELAASSEPGGDRPLSLELIFWRQIQQHAFFDAATTLDRLIASDSPEHGCLERTLASVFSRMELVLQAITQEDSADVMQHTAFSEMLHKLSQAKTYQEMRDSAYDILATLEDQLFTPQNSRNKKLPAIEQFMLEHYVEQSLSAASLSQQFRISTSYLSRIFKADMGVGVVDYIHNIRISAAKELLRGTDDTLDEIALKTGFSNRWVFMRVFKKLEGMTPGEFRQHCAEDR